MSAYSPIERLNLIVYEVYLMLRFLIFLSKWAGNYTERKIYMNFSGTHPYVYVTIQIVVQNPRNSTWVEVEALQLLVGSTLVLPVWVVWATSIFLKLEWDLQGTRNQRINTWNPCSIRAMRFPQGPLRYGVWWGGGGGSAVAAQQLHFVTLRAHIPWDWWYVVTTASDVASSATAVTSG